MKANEEASHGEKARLLPIAPVLGSVPDPPDAVAAQDDAPRSLLARLRSLDGELDANRRFVSRVKDRESEAVSAARGPASSPEEARATHLEAQSFLAASAGKLREAEERIADLAQERGDLFERMASTGFFEGRWVNDDGSAVYLESAGAEPPAYDLHEGPWWWVKDAPPGEDPRETLRRGPLLERAFRRNREMILLLGVTFAAYCLATALPPPPLEQYAAVATLAILAGLLFALPLAREKLFGRWSAHPEAERRLAEEAAARAQIDFIRRGEQAKPPSLDELAEAILGLRGRMDEDAKIKMITVVEDPENEARTTANPDDAPGGGEDER